MRAPAAAPAGARSADQASADPVGSAGRQPSPRGPGSPDSLARRVASAAILGPLFVLAAYAGGVVFGAVVALLVVLATGEYARLAVQGNRLAAALVLAVGLLALGERYLSPASGWRGTSVLVALFGSLALGLRSAEPRDGFRLAAFTLVGALYAAWLFSFLVALRELPRELDEVPYRRGFVYVLLPVVLTWSSDIGAYAAGRLWGRRRLLPRISPGKTVAGAFGGIAFGALAAALFFGSAAGSLPRIGIAGAVVLGVAASVVAQLGDLAESLLKRAFGVKDTSTLIPGHGGVLDRFDALLFTAPAAYVFFKVSVP